MYSPRLEPLTNLNHKKIRIQKNYVYKKPQEKSMDALSPRFWQFEK